MPSTCLSEPVNEMLSDLICVDDEFAVVGIRHNSDLARVESLKNVDSVKSIKKLEQNKHEENLNTASVGSGSSVINEDEISIHVRNGESDKRSSLTSNQASLVDEFVQTTDESEKTALIGELLAQGADGLRVLRRAIQMGATATDLVTLTHHFPMYSEKWRRLGTSRETNLVALAIRSKNFDALNVLAELGVMPYEEKSDILYALTELAEFEGLELAEQATMTLQNQFGTMLAGSIEHTEGDDLLSVLSIELEASEVAADNKINKAEYTELVEDWKYIVLGPNENCKKAVNMAVLADFNSLLTKEFKDESHLYSFLDKEMHSGVSGLYIDLYRIAQFKSNRRKALSEQDRSLLERVYKDINSGNWVEVERHIDDVKNNDILFSIAIMILDNFAASNALNNKLLELAATQPRLILEFGIYGNWRLVDDLLENKDIGKYVDEFGKGLYFHVANQNRDDLAELISRELNYHKDKYGLTPENLIAGQISYKRGDKPIGIK